MSPYCLMLLPRVQGTLVFKRNFFLRLATRDLVDSGKYICYTEFYSMTDQLPLFRQKRFPATLTRGLPITPPQAESIILETLPAYFTYLQSQGYSFYTPADFCGDLKK